MRCAVLLGAVVTLSLSGCAAQPNAGGGGIISLNPCADAMLIELIPPERIAAISHYSADPLSSSIDPSDAQRFRTTRGRAEEVVMMRPDLVIGSSFTPPSAREAFARAGLRAVYLDGVASVDASREQIRMLAEMLDAQIEGEAMIARIDEAVEQARWNGAPTTALLWIGGNLVSGGGTLLHDMMTRAGFSDHAAHYGLQMTGPLALEHVVIDPPKVMLVPEAEGRDRGSRTAKMRSAVLAHSEEGVYEATFSRRLANCGGPVIVNAMKRLAEIRREVEE